jgi:2-haloacid dehalogenase
MKGKMMTKFRPKYITFDLYGTLIKFEMSAMTRRIFAGRVNSEQMDDFLDDFEAYRLDEALGAWKPYRDVIGDALRRACKRWNLHFDPVEALSIYEAVPTWGPHPDVPAGLAIVAKEYPLVVLSNASDDQIYRNVEKLGAPFHAVFTAEQARAYKPRMQAFEYMLDQLGCGPGDILHVSASLRYDLMTAHDLRIRNKVYVNRGYEPGNTFFEYTEIKAIDELPGVVGLLEGQRV